MIKKSLNRMGLILLMVAVSMLCCLLASSSGSAPDGEARLITTVDSLRHELEQAQLLGLPVEQGSTVYDGGDYLFEPAPDDIEASLLLRSLVPDDSRGLRCWPVTLQEDPDTRETVILAADGEEAVRLPPEAEYDPLWAFELLFPLQGLTADVAAYDPARVSLSLRLVVPAAGSASSKNLPGAHTGKTPAPAKTAPAQAKGASGETAKPAKPAGVKVTPATPAPSASPEMTLMALGDGIVDSDGDGLSDDEERRMGRVLAWGQNTSGQATVPTALTNALAVAAGDSHSLALKTNRTVAAWGQNSYGQCTVPAAATNVLAVVAGGYHSLALRADGAVVAWGRNTYQQCTVPALASNAVALSAGLYHSAALRPNGTVVAWGQNSYQQCTVPVAVSNAVALSSGTYHNLALRANGSVVAWGQNTYAQCTVPAAATNVVAVAAGGYHSLALRANGSVVAWGRNTYQQCTVPAAATNVVAIAAGQYFSLAVCANGRVVAWGQNTSGQCTGATNRTCVVAVAAGGSHGLAVRGPHPFKADTDGDGITDGWELTQGLDPLTPADAASDVDSDGLTALQEFMNHTDPRLDDTDGDLMRDGWEVSHLLNPLEAGDSGQDAEPDGLTNLREYQLGTDPYNADTDGDGMPDGWEVDHGLNPVNPADAGQDADTDDLSNLDEFMRNTDPRDPDTDEDGMPDGWEVKCGFDPLEGSDATADPDGDDFSNVYEFFRNSAPTNALSIPQPSLYVNGSAATNGNGTLQSPFKTLRAALQAAADYGIIQVADGVYAGEENRNLSFLGKPLMLIAANGASRCIIDCQGQGSGVVFENGETILSVLRGFTIRNGTAEGGALRCSASGPLIQACRLESNGSPDQPGGAVYNLFACPTLENCIIARNIASLGAALYNDASSPLLRNCTLAGNVAASGGGAVYNADMNSRPAMINCIAWDNGDSSFAGEGLTFARHSVLEAGYTEDQIAAGTGLFNSSANPLLTKAYRLKAGSPCIDAGSASAPLRDIDGEGRIDDPSVTNVASGVDIGADEFADTDQDALADAWETQNFGDLGRDGTGDFDHDGLLDKDEYLAGSSPVSRDTDGDGMPDGWEVEKQLDSLDSRDALQDFDRDGLSNREEFRALTDPLDPDTDKDGLSDYREWSSGRVVAWGTNNVGQCNVPVSLTNMIAIDAWANYNYALRGDGTFAVWPQNTLTNAASNLVSFATGGNHVLAMKADGSVVAWGNNSSGQCNVPATASNALAFAAGWAHSLALRPDGTVVAWGNNTEKQCTVPAGATNVIAIAAGDYHSLALRQDGRIVAWGQNTYLQCAVPGSALNIVALAAGPMHNLAIRADGRVIAWGADKITIVNGYYTREYNLYGQCTVPASATNAIAVAVGQNHSLALRRDGSVIAWGLNTVGQCSGATNVSCAVALAAGWNHSVALRRLDPLKADTDGDTIPDGWESSHGLDPLNKAEAALDADGDTLSNLAEYINKTDPHLSDTDGDGMPDGWEVSNQLNPLNVEDALLDADGDGVSNKQEYDLGTDPRAGYCMKEIFANGIPSDWTQSSWPHVGLYWRTLESWSGWYVPSSVTPPTSIRGQMLWASRYLPGKLRIATPVLNLGRDMSNVMLRFLYWKGGHGSEGIVRLNIYGVTRTAQAGGLFVDEEVKLSEIDLKGGFSEAWSSFALRLPQGSATRQVIFEYESTQDYSFDDHLTFGICLGEISLSGDDGRVAYQPVTPVIENGPALMAASREIPYSCPLSVRGGVPPFQWRYHWSVVEGALPAGLVLDPNTGAIQGIPVGQGKSSFKVEAKNDEGMADTNQFELTVLESVTALSENFDGKWIPTGWTANGWGPLVDVKAPNGGNTNVWGRGSTTSYASLVTPVVDLEGAPDKAVLRFRYRNPLYTSLNFRDHLLVWFEDATGTRMLAGTQNILRYPYPTWQIIPDTQSWKEAVIPLPTNAASGRIIFQTYITGDNFPGGAECGVFIDDVRVFAGYTDPLFLAWLASHFPDGVGSGFYDDPDGDDLVNIAEYQKGTDPHNKDCDNDGLKDGDEVAWGTDPQESDTDGDRLSDGWEVYYGYPPLVKNDGSADADHDGLADREESLIWANPLKEDSDDDGFGDRQEYDWGTNPLYWDTDKDGFSDYEETLRGTDPKNALSIGSSISGTLSYSGRQTGPIYISATHSLRSSNRMTIITAPGEYTLRDTTTLSGYSLSAFCDLNGNGTKEFWEPSGEYPGNPLVLVGNTNGIDIVLSDPDSDTDGLPDWWELEFFSDLSQTAGSDFDNDGLNNGDECAAGTSPTDSTSLTRSVSGTVAYTGLQTGAIVIAAHTQLGEWGSGPEAIITSPGSFDIHHVPTGVEYWVEAYRDSNGNGSNDAWEATGYISEAVTVTGEVSGLMITLSDPDADSDGLPDWWEMLIIHEQGNDNITSIYDVHPGDDYDQDGVSNGNEYVSGTPPSDSRGFPPVIGFINHDTTVVENNTTVTIPLQMYPPSANTVQARVFVYRSTATAGSDYEFTETEVTFSAGQTNQSFFVTIKKQALAEAEKAIVFGVSRLSGVAVVGSKNRHVLRIKDETDGTGAEPAPGWVTDTEDTLRFRVHTPLWRVP